MSRKWHEIKIKLPNDLIDLFGEFITVKHNRGVVIEPEGALRIYVNQEEFEKGLVDIIVEDIKNTGINFHEIEIYELSENDWLSNWKEGFKPLDIGEKIVIKPPWEKYEPQNDKIVININPAMAFGTGHHGTTSLIIKELQDMSDEMDFSSLSALDVGSGSGILAITAAKLGARHVTAFDNDPDIYENALENIALNNMEGKIDLRITEIDKITGYFDIALANLDRGAFLKIGDKIIEKTKENGEILISGILTNQFEEIKAFLSGKNVRIIKVNVDDKEKEWMLIRMKKI